MEKYELRNYVTADGKDIVSRWLTGLRDRAARIVIDRRLNRMENGNFGDHKFCQDGVWELRIDLGPGYRIYYGLIGQQVVLLLCGGDKGTQSADIARARAYWHDWHRRSAS